ncbi:hypothetical protein T11_18436 [Trichinella zimbabwensis]|uniref:Stress response protein nst1 n=1 Tax=Trichinella zimbabwensis TaxID=268475 RepID=A0A0V1HBZ5_9BILA|nr:hypothetical protein T11_18436 [Trichinella zimbabwensis]
MLAILFIALLAALANPSKSENESQLAEYGTASPEDVARIYCAAKKCSGEREKLEKAKESKATKLRVAYLSCKNKCIHEVLKSEKKLKKAQKFYEKDYPKLVKERKLSDLKFEMEEEKMMHKREIDVEKQRHKDAIKDEEKRHKEAMKYATKKGKKQEKEKHKQAKKAEKEQHKESKVAEKQRHKDEKERLKQEKKDLKKKSPK